MKRPQWITAAAGVFLVASLFWFGKTKGPHTPPKQQPMADEHEGHDHSKPVSIDTLLAFYKKDLAPAQQLRVNSLEKSLAAPQAAGTATEQQLHVYHQLARFWADSARQFIPFIWYTGEAARLENSEKSLTFAAHLLVNNLRRQDNEQVRQWEALQAKDLFERSLKINPDNDSSHIGLGATILFGGISDQPMTGLSMITDVVKRDSTNVYAQMTLAEGSLLSNQVPKAISRLETVNRLQPDNLEAILMLADIYERTGDKKNATVWYGKSLPLLKDPSVKDEVKKRIETLK